MIKEEFIGRATDLARKAAEMARHAPVLRKWIVEQWNQKHRPIGWKKVVGYHLKKKMVSGHFELVERLVVLHTPDGVAYRVLPI
jgi:hypothetical protein